MTIKVSRVDGVQIPAAQDRRALHGQWSTGIYTSGDGLVEAQASPNMTVKVAAITGLLIDDGVSFGEGKLVFESDASVNVTIATSDATNPRIDLVVAKVTAVEFGGADAFTLAAVTGTPAASPSAPATPTRTYVLAEVRVDAGVTTIQSNKITDRRTLSGISSASGDVIEYVPGSNQDSPAFAGIWTTWLTLGNLTVPTWATKARFQVTISGWFGVTPVMVNKLRLTVGAVSDGAAPEITSGVSDRRSTSWQGRITGLASGLQSIVIENQKVSGGGAFRADATSHVAVGFWWEA